MAYETQTFTPGQVLFAEQMKHIEAGIVALEKAVEQNANAAQSIPDYVRVEAMQVLDKVVSAQGKRTFTFAAITDMHYGSSDYIDGVIHACQGMQHISERIKLDAVAVLGDYTDEHQMDTEAAVTDLEEMNALLDPLRSNVNLRVKGNHDHRPNAAAQTYRYIMAYSDATAWGSRIGGYFYRDFDAYKLRVICLNTTEIARDNLSVSVGQYQWFADSLDLSAKEDAAKWGILLLSHHPLDWTVTDGNYRFGPIINAYQTGTMWTDGSVSCNYAGKNAAPIIANIHGHIHNLLTDKIYVGEPGNSEQTSVWRLATPASRVDFVNHYSGVWVENAWYDKTQNTADDTSFCVYCVDLDAQTIKAFCYGAGYDRSLTYDKPGQSAYTNLLDVFDVTFNERFSSSGLADCAGFCYFSIPCLEAYGKTLRFKGVSDVSTKDGKGYNEVRITDGNATNVNAYTFSDAKDGNTTARIFYTDHLVDEGNGVYAIALTDATMESPSYYMKDGNYFTIGLVLRTDGAEATEADLAGVVVTLDDMIE